MLNDMTANTSRHQPSHPYNLSAFSALYLSQQQRYRQIVFAIKSLSPGFPGNNR
jgi:hypothetical protein